MRLLIAIGKRDRARFNFFFSLQIDLKCRIFFSGFTSEMFCSLSHDSIVDTVDTVADLFRSTKETE